MAGYEKRKPFKGKKFHRDLREFKSQEIKRSLVHRARLRKSYFKLVDAEDQERNSAKHSREHNHDDNEDSRSEEADSGSEKSDNEEHGENLKASRHARTGTKLEKQDSVYAKESKRQQDQRALKQEARPRLTFAERARIAKERKEHQREEKLQQVQQRRQMLEKRNIERQKHRESLSQRTRRGQPVMGPKITDLLDKIRNGTS